MILIRQFIDFLTRLMARFYDVIGFYVSGKSKVEVKTDEFESVSFINPILSYGHFIYYFGLGGRSPGRCGLVPICTTTSQIARRNR